MVSSRLSSKLQRGFYLNSLCAKEELATDRHRRNTDKTQINAESAENLWPGIGIVPMKHALEAHATTRVYAACFNPICVNPC